ncbi:MAG TPA: aminotransferase class IV [Chitinophagaceae bacterium]|nr:aminotransferase class IV [Chitinophagaceae bacterium]
MSFILYNGELAAGTGNLLSAANRGFRYGDGLFETMRVVNGRIPLWPLHAHRLWKGMGLLRFPALPAIAPEQLLAQLLSLCEKNHCPASARIRLSVWRGDGALYDLPVQFGYLAESAAIPLPGNQLPGSGLHLGIFSAAQKSTDTFSNLKSSGFLPYVMAAEYAQQNGMDDCLVLNTHGRIADSTVANLFICKKGKLYTPPLQEGCVAGVMRAWLLQNQQELGLHIRETAVSEDDLFEAEEVWLTNAVAGLKWVARFRDKIYGNQLAQQVYEKISAKLFS